MNQQTIHPNPEDLFRLERKNEAVRSEKSASDSKETLVHPDTVAISDGIDVAETGTGGISEQKEHAAEQKGIGHVQSQTQGVANQVQTAAIKTKLLEKLPAERVMKREIRETINNQINHLIKSAKKAEKRDDYFELNRIVALIRSLKDTLADLVYATYEMIKNLWLKVVHGIS